MGRTEVLKRSKSQAGPLRATWRKGLAAIGAKGRLRLMLAGSRGPFIGSLLVLVIFSSPSVASQPTLTELLRALHLSSYPATMRPPEFSGQSPEGKMVSLAGLRGKVVLLNFWAAWCPDCRPEMPLFEQLHRDFATKGLTVLGINVREGADTVQSYAKELGLTFPLVLDPRGKITSAYGVIGIPSTFLIGRDGRPVALAVGPRDWASAPARAIIKMLLAERIER